MTIYLRHIQYRDCVSVACDEDTKYWIFDDSPEPVGLTCDPKSKWARITHDEYEAIRAAHPLSRDDIQDVTEQYFNQVILKRAIG